MIQTGTALRHKSSGEVVKYLAGLTTEGAGVLHLLVSDTQGYVYRLGTRLMDDFEVEQAHPAVPGSPGAGGIPAGVQPQFATPAPGSFTNTAAPVDAPAPITPAPPVSSAGAQAVVEPEPDPSEVLSSDADLDAPSVLGKSSTKPPMSW